MSKQRLFIAEKPSVGKAIAEVLGVTGKGKGYLQCGDDRVTWFFGHMLEQAEPDTYTSDDVPRTDKGKKIWRVEDLPIIPVDWNYNPREDAQEQLDIVGKLYQQADVIVHAGDPDREGQLLVDQPLDLLFGNTKPVVRYWCNAVDELSIKRALKDLKDNAGFTRFGEAAEARGKADWLIGMNLSRAFTLRAHRGGSRALLPVGRVQTPTLNLVVLRDRAIENFTPKAFYRIVAVFQHANGSLLAEWVAGDDQKGLDEENRLIDKAIADTLTARFQGMSAVVKAYVQEAEKKGQPKALALTDVTVLASRKWGYSADQVLDLCQSLYETHKLTTYPRTDCAFLPESQFADAPLILETLKGLVPHLAELIDGADPKIKSKTWNDAKVTAHHGIIPTTASVDISKLSPAERNIHELVVRYYLAQFYPVHEFKTTDIELDVDGELFKASGKVITKNGWMDALGQGKTADDSDDEDGKEQSLPVMKVEDAVGCVKVSRIDSSTKAPKRLNEGSLVQMMQNIHKYIDDEEHRKMLREGDGIGTNATRAGIIKELKERGFLEVKGKSLISTKLGRSIIDAFPEVVKSPVLTAMYERRLKAIEEGQGDAAEFLRQQEDLVRKQVANANHGSVKIAGAKQAAVVSTVHMCKACNKGLIRRAGKKPNTHFWACSGYPTCTWSYPDFKGKPNLTKGNPGKAAAPTTEGA
ncbi:DNA topoisomerase 3 [Pseudomonas juntendi]|uniref:DNA topoisomerase 3 n=1 Tax=Pseudomonas juntendi TaxID=2666183 RepID=UPI003B94D0E2